MRISKKSIRNSGISLRDSVCDDMIDSRKCIYSHEVSSWCRDQIEPLWIKVDSGVRGRIEVQIRRIIRGR